MLNGLEHTGPSGRTHRTEGVGRAPVALAGEVALVCRFAARGVGRAGWSRSVSVKVMGFRSPRPPTFDKAVEPVSGIPSPDVRHRHHRYTQFTGQLCVDDSRLGTDQNGPGSHALP